MFLEELARIRFFVEPENSYGSNLKPLFLRVYVKKTKLKGSKIIGRVGETFLKIMLLHVLKIVYSEHSTFILF